MFFTKWRRRLALHSAPVADLIIVVVALLSTASLCYATSSSPPSPLLPDTTASCLTWAPHSVQNITVDGFARFGAAEGCGAVLINVSLTFFALPQSTIVLDGWSMRDGGYVAIQGPPSAPWSIRDVAVMVSNSVIEALDGPAVSVVLGAGYDASAAFAGGDVVLRNVSLSCFGSRLWSNNSASSAPAAIAAVLSATLASTLDAFAPSVTIDQFTVVAVESDLRSESTATVNDNMATVASIAATRYGGGVTVANCVLCIMRCNAAAAVLLGTAEPLPTEATAVSAVAGVAFGKLSSVGLTVTSTAATVVHSELQSAVTIGSTENAYAGSSVAGVAIGFIRYNSPVTVANMTTLYVGWSNATSTIICTSTNGEAFAASSVAGVVVGQTYLNAPVTVANSTAFYVGWSNATSTSTSNGTSSTLITNAFAGSSVAGVAMGWTDSLITIENGTSFLVGWSNATSNATSTNTNHYTYAGSSVSGVAMGWTDSFVTIANETSFFVVWSNTNSSTSTGTGNAYAIAGSSVAGVALGQAKINSPVTIASSTTLYVGWCNATSSSTSTGTITDVYTNAGSSVAGVAPTSTTLSPALSVSSASTVSACATGVGNAAVSCATVSGSLSSYRPALCCTAAIAPNPAFPVLQPRGPPQVTLPTFYHRPPPPSSQRGTATTSAAPRPATPSCTSTLTASPSGQDPLITLRRVTSATEATARPRRPFRSDTQSRHHSGTSTLRAETQPVPPTPLPPSPSPDPRLQDAGVRDFGLGLNPTVVTAVVATGYGSSVVAGALSPTSGNKPSATSRLMSGGECTVIGDQDSSSLSFPQPDDWSLMPRLTVIDNNLGSDAGSGANAAAAKLLMTVALVAMVWAVNVAWAVYGGSMSNQRRVQLLTRSPRSP